MDLMALGAPPELLMGATRAQADEIAHARQFFSMATAFAGHPIGPGDLDLGGVDAQTPTPAQVLVQTILEGCINETLAATEATWLSERATLRTIRRVQRQIAADETRHAALGWKTVRWLLKEHPTLLSLAEQTFAQARPTGQTPFATIQDRWMAAYGCMPESKRTVLHMDVWEQVIGPCMEALLSAVQRDIQASDTYSEIAQPSATAATS